MHISFLGLGAMGRRMAARLLDVDGQLAVYNRSADPLRAFADAGAQTHRDPAKAVVGADVVISMLTDDAASEAVWRAALPGVSPDATLIEASTVSPARIAALGAQVDAIGATLIDAPVVGTLPHAEEGALTWLIGGPAAAIEPIGPILDAMGAARHHVGARGQGAAAKLMVNAWFAGQVALLSEVLAMGAQGGIDGARALEVLTALPVTAPAMGVMGGMMLAGDDAPRFPINLVVKDLAYANALAGGPMSQAALRAFEAAAARGLGARNITGINRLR